MGRILPSFPMSTFWTLSSTQVRQALAQGGGQELLTDPVYGYIQRRGLYIPPYGPAAPDPGPAAAHRPELSEAQAHAPCAGHGAGGRPPGPAVWGRRDPGPGGRPAPRLHQEAGYGGAAGPVRPISHPAGRPGAARPEAAARPKPGRPSPGTCSAWTMPCIGPFTGTPPAMRT